MAIAQAPKPPRQAEGAVRGQSRTQSGPGMTPASSTAMRDFGMRWWLALRDPVAHLHPSFFLMPDDWLYAGLLTAWVVLVAVVTYLLLGWASAAALIAVVGLVGLGTVAIQSRQPRRPDRV